MITEEAIRAELERRIGRALSDQDWAFLEEHGTLGDIREYGLDPATVETVRGMVAFGDPSARRQRPGRMLPARPDPGRLGERVEALSVLFASEAARDPAVVGFRERVLGDRLLEQAEVGPWIEREAEKEGAPSMLVDVVVPAGSIDATTRPGRLLVRRARKNLEALSARRELLAYGVPEDAWARHVPVRIGGTLDRLRELSEQLADRYRWDPGQATIFALTGAIPLLSPIKARLNASPTRPSATARVILTVDPTTSPAQVAKTYARIRSGWLGRHRSLSPKHLRLAAFTAERPTDETWAERLRAWNAKARSGERYKAHQVANFARDCTKATRRLLHPTVDWRAILGGEPAED